MRKCEDIKRILIIFGTRPEAIKMAPLVLEFQKSVEFEMKVCVTGQHREMLDQVLKIFNIVPDYDLDIMKPNQTLEEITSSVIVGVGRVLDDFKPNVVLVHGDTTTAYASAVAAFYHKIHVAHVEAGLRTHNIYSPFPEEFNRQSIETVSKFNFCPTQMAADNLRREAKPEENIYITGNTAIDAMRYTVRADYKHELIDWAEGSRLVLLTAHRRENLGEPLHNMLKAVRKIVDNNKDVKVIYPVHLNPSVRAVVTEELSGEDRIKLVEPLDVEEFHNLIAHSFVIMTDSGGVQEEAPSLNKPVLVMRDTTERPEGVAAGTIKLVGTDVEGVYEGCQTLLDDAGAYNKMCNADNPYGDGHAAERIIEIIKEQLK